MIGKPSQVTLWFLFLIFLGKFVLALNSPAEDNFTHQERKVDLEWKRVNGKRGSSIDAMTKSEVKDLMKHYKV